MSDARGKSKRGGRELKHTVSKLTPEQNAGAWAQRLSITEPKAMKAFIMDFLRLEPGYKCLPVPPSDSTRCAICRRKVFLDSRNKAECNGLCTAGVKAKTVLALRGQGKTWSGGKAGVEHVTTYSAVSMHAREWHQRIGGGVDVQTFAAFWAALPAEHRATVPPAPEGVSCPHCRKPTKLMRKVFFRATHDRSRTKKDGGNLWDKQCDGSCNGKGVVIILRAWTDAGHAFVELEDKTPAAAPRRPPHRAAPKKQERPAPVVPPVEVDLEQCTLHEKEEEKQEVSPRPKPRPKARRATQAAPKDWFQAPTRQEALDEASSASAAVGEARAGRTRTASAWSASSADGAAPASSADGAAPAPSTRGLVIVCVGLPGAGKSTFFQTHFAGVGSIIRCSQDVLKSRQRVIAAVDAALQRGDAVFVDRTNVDKTQRAHWVKLAKKHGARCVALEFRTPADLCAQRCEGRENHEGGLDRRNRECRRIVRMMSSEFRPIRQNEGFDNIFCVDEDYAPTKAVAAIKGMIPYRPGATGLSVDPAAPAFVPGAPPPSNPTWVQTRSMPPPVARAPRWVPPSSSEDADLARALAASCEAVPAARPPLASSEDADLARALAASRTDTHSPHYVHSVAAVLDEDDDDELRRALAASLAETRTTPAYYAPPPAAPAYAPPPPPPMASGPRADAVALLAEMGISPHLADLFIQQEISRDVAQVVERADLVGLLSEPDIQKFMNWQTWTR